MDSSGSSNLFVTLDLWVSDRSVSRVYQGSSRVLTGLSCTRPTGTRTWTSQINELRLLAAVLVPSRRSLPLPRSQKPCIATSAHQPGLSCANSVTIQILQSPYLNGCLLLLGYIGYGYSYRQVNAGQWIASQFTWDSSFLAGNAVYSFWICPNVPWQACTQRISRGNA